MSIGLCQFSFTGAAREVGHRPDPQDPYDLMQMAAENGLASVEFSFHGKSDEEIAQCRAKLEELGLRVTLAGGLVNAEELRKWLPTAKALGAKSIRTVLSGILEGDRRNPPGTEWQQYIDGLVEELKAVTGLAEELEVAIALENHQDATSDDLLYMCEASGSPMVGVNLDCGNALAVGEDPIEYAEKIAPRIKNVHLKDYIIYLTESGYRLVRCAFGDGVVPFKELFEIFDREAPDSTRNIENGATTARHIRLLENFFWDYYPERPLKSVLPALRIALQHARPAEEDWRTPHEHEEPVEARLAYEMEQFDRSVENARKLLS